MVAEELGQANLFVTVVPQTAGFTLTLRQELTAIGWIALSKKISVRGKAEIRAMDDVLDEWDLYLHPL